MFRVQHSAGQQGSSGRYPPLNRSRNYDRLVPGGMLEKALNLPGVEQVQAAADCARLPANYKAKDRAGVHDSSE